MSRYKSRGTVCHSLSTSDKKATDTSTTDDKVGDKTNETIIEKVIFFPSSEYSIKSQNKEYAIFFSDPSSDPLSDQSSVRSRKFDSEKGLGIVLSVARALTSYNDAPGITAAGSSILLAAKNQTRVEIEVEFPCEDDRKTELYLVGITIPAK